MDHSTASPFADLLHEMREEGAQRAASGTAVERRRPTRRPRPPAGPRRPRVEGAPEPELQLEASVVSGARAGEQRPPWRWAVAIVLHAAVGAALVVLPLLKADDLPSPVASTKAIFVEPSLPPPPPPPPPPPTWRAWSCSSWPSAPTAASATCASCAASRCSTRRPWMRRANGSSRRRSSAACPWA